MIQDSNLCSHVQIQPNMTTQITLRLGFWIRSFNLEKKWQDKDIFSRPMFSRDAMKLSFAHYDRSNYLKIQKGRHLGQNWCFETLVGATKWTVILILVNLLFSYFLKLFSSLVSLFLNFFFIFISHSKCIKPHVCNTSPWGVAIPVYINEIYVLSFWLRESFDPT